MSSPLRNASFSPGLWNEGARIPLHSPSPVAAAAGVAAAAVAVVTSSPPTTAGDRIEPGTAAGTRPPAPALPSGAAPGVAEGPTTTAPVGLQKTLADHPHIKTNQDLINHYYRQGGGTWEGASRRATADGTSLNKLLRDREGSVAAPESPTPPTSSAPPASTTTAPPASTTAPPPPAKPEDQKITNPGFSERPGIPGAYYDKVESPPTSKNLGVSATVTLPHFTADPARNYPPAGTPADVLAKMAKSGTYIEKEGPMDRPSMYLGSHASAVINGQKVEAEADIGMGWNRRFDKAGNPTFVAPAVQNSGERPTPAQIYTKDAAGKFRNQMGDEYQGKDPLQPHFCWKPFARTHEPVLGANGSPVMKNGQVKMDNHYTPIAAKENQDAYFYSGEKMSMSVGRNQGDPATAVSFTVKGEGKEPLKATIASNVLGRPDALVSEKRVTSIDQFTVFNGSNHRRPGELKPGERMSVESETTQQVLPTGSTLEGAKWHSVTVNQVGNKSVPMTGRTFVHSRLKDSAPVDEDKTFERGGYNASGGETVDIHPAAR